MQKTQSMSSGYIRYLGAMYRQAAYQIVDLRDPSAGPGSHPDADAFVLINDNKIFLFNYGTGNTVEWTELLKLVDPRHNSGQAYTILTKNGNVLLSGLTGDWTIPSRWSQKIREKVAPLYETGLVKADAEVYHGRWSSGTGKLLGTVEEFVTQKNLDLPDSIVLYHGTSSDRYYGKALDGFNGIKQTGLKPVSTGQRVFSKDALSKHPEWRGAAVYLTVDLYKAHWYATKATNVSRNHGRRGVYPVVLRITIPRSHYDKFRPDDDFLTQHIRNFKQYDPRQLDLFEDLSWLGSLGEMSQVAYMGSIPPEWISVESVDMHYRKFDYPKVAMVIYQGQLYRLADAEIPVMSAEEAREQEDFVGFHCQKRARNLRHDDFINTSAYGDSIPQILDSLPDTLRAEVLEKNWLNNHPGQYDDGYDEWTNEVDAFLREHNIRWIFVSDNKTLTDYGDYCYGVMIPFNRALAVIPDIGVNDSANAYVYDANEFTPGVVEIAEEDPTSAPTIRRRWV